MYLKSEFKLKKILLALLSIIIAIALAFTVACGETDDGNDDDDNKPSTPTTTVTDYQVLKNGDFEYGIDEKTTFPYASPTGWSKSLGSDVNSATSGAGTSGVIDTSDEAFEKLTAKNKPLKAGSSNEYVNPRTPDYFGLVKNEFNKDDEDKRVNPDADGTKILMINNQNSSTAGLGTAQKYRASTTVNVLANEYAVLSFWANTLNLKTLNPDVAPGAYVLLAIKTGSNSYEDIVVRDINTNGEWAYFSAVIEGSELATSTINLTFGLGEGNGTDQSNYVEGFAFFDNVQVKTISKDEYASSKVGADLEINANDVKAEGYSLKGKAYIDNGEKKDFNAANVFTTTKLNLSFNASATLTEKNVSGEVNYNELNPLYNLYKTENLIGVKNASALTDDEKTALGDAIANLDKIGTDPSLIYFSFKNASSASYVSNVFTVAGGDYDYITFYAKVKAGNENSDKLKVEVFDYKDTACTIANADKALFSSIATTTVKDGKYGDWVKYQAFVNNPTEAPISYKIKITFGFDEVWTDSFALQTGNAVVADLRVYDSDEELYSEAATGETIAKTQIYGAYTSYGDVVENTTGSDVYNVTVDKSQTFTIMNKPATNVSGYTFKSNDKSSVDHGVVNGYYVKTKADGTIYYGDDSVKLDGVSVIPSLKSTEANKHSQVLVIDNNKDKVTVNNKEVDLVSKYISTTNVVGANSISRITIKVRVTGENNKAIVSLVSSTLENGAYPVLTLKAGDVEEKLQSTVTSKTHKKGAWTEVNFYVESGNKDISFRVQVENVNKGAVYTDGTTVSVIDANKMLADKNAYKADFKTAYEANEEEKANYIFTSKAYTRVDTTVKELDEDGNEVTSVIKYQPTNIYEGNSIVKFFSYATIDVENEIDNTEKAPEETPEEEQPEEDAYTVSTSAVLEISSIVIAIALILVMIAVLVRNALKKRAAKMEKVAAYYEATSTFDRNTREKTLRKIAEKKAKIALAEKEEDEEVEEYDYEAAQNVIEEGEEETAQETIDEAIEAIVEETTSEETLEEVVEEVTETTETEKTEE